MAPAGATISVVDPACGEIIGVVPKFGAAETRLAMIRTITQENSAFTSIPIVISRAGLRVW